MDPRLAERRRTVAETRVRAGIRRLLVIAAIFAVVLAGVAVLRSPLFSLERVDVGGDQQTDPVALLEAAGVVEGTPLIEIDLEAAVEALVADPRIATAEVERSWPRGLTVTVTERFPVAWVDQGGGWQQVAIDGVVLDQGEPDATAPRIRAVAAGSRALEAALAFVDALPDSLSQGMVIDARTDEINATWNEMTIRLGRPTDMEAKARAFEVVAADALEPGSEITLIAPDRPAVLPPTTTTLPEEG